MNEVGFNPNLQESREAIISNSDEITVDEVLYMLTDEDFSRISDTLKYEKTYYPEDYEKDDTEEVIAGALFEILNSKEQKKDEAVPETFKNQLIDIISKPKGIFIKKLKKYRKPDLIDISYSQEERKYIINSITEITYGRLNKRKGDQITSLKDDMNEIINVLKDNLKPSKNKGYEDLSIVIDSIMVSEDLELNLILTKDKQKMPDDLLFTMPDKLKDEVKERISTGAVKVSYSKYDKALLKNTAMKIAPLFF